MLPISVDLFARGQGGRRRNIVVAATTMLLAIAAPLLSVAASGRSDARVDVVEVATIDQDGRALKFASEVIGDRIVVVNFIYTSCKTLCPLSSAIFARLQEMLLQSEAGKDARLVSITLDPRSDTPRRLKASAQQYDAGARWLWITGSEADIAALTNGLGASAVNFRDHDSLTLVGDARNARWTAFNALPGPEQLLAEVERLASARTQGGGKP